MKLAEELVRIYTWLESSGTQWTTIRVAVREDDPKTGQVAGGNLLLERDTKHMQVFLWESGHLEVETLDESLPDRQSVFSYRFVANPAEVGAMILPLIRDLYKLDVPSLSDIAT